MVVVVVVVAVQFLHSPAAVVGGPITSLQKGEYGSVPDACRSVPAAILRQYLGAAPKSIRPQPGQCTFTVDAKPRFRQLNVQVQALQPNAGYGNGSATADAKYTLAQQRALLAKPARRAPWPPATITPVGLGDKAFVAVQVYRSGVVANKVTVLVRYRNVLITTYLLGDVSGGFGPAPISEMRAGALAAASALLAVVKAQPATG
jgi:hypothetical protein